VQDDWQIASNLTLNLGLRYDLSVNANGNEYAVPPFTDAGRPNDTNNVQPRVGFAYSLNDRTVLRGGTGTYFAAPLSVETFWMAQINRLRVIQITNDGRPNFAADPLNGQPLPTLEQADQRFCHVRNVPGCLRLAIQELMGPDEYTRDLARTWQTSIGVQRQVGAAMAIEADYVYSQGRHEKDVIDNVNLTFNPATGANYPFSDISRRAYPEYGLISLIARTGRSSYHALQTGVTRRLRNRWQASGTYTLSGLWNAEAPPHSGLYQVPFTTAPDLGGEFTFDSNDMRHRAMFNGIWQVGRGFQVSGVHYFGAGNRAAGSYGGDRRNLGAGGELRLRLDGTIVPRNEFLQPAQNRTGIRIQQRLPLASGVSVDLIAEAFNVFNRPNWTLETQESSADYNKRVVAQYRTAQFGFRLMF
jgi:hypothetical protein